MPKIDDLVRRSREVRDEGRGLTARSASESCSRYDREHVDRAATLGELARDAGDVLERALAVAVGSYGGPCEIVGDYGQINLGHTHPQVTVVAGSSVRVPEGARVVLLVLPPATRAL